LDETLLFSNFSCAKRFETAYRPGAKEFIIQLSKYFEIIVFTSSVKEYAEAVIKPFIQFVDHALYKYHVTRGMNLSNTVKDLSRIGRRL
jgi:TFIIF-interacting CTD phosphatase-like protein